MIISHSIHVQLFEWVFKPFAVEFPRKTVILSYAFSPNISIINNLFTNPFFEIIFTY